jgi:hypothetical protein
MMQTVPLGIIKPAPHLTVLARRHRLAEEQTRRPRTMVRLQTQFIVPIRGRELLQSGRQSAAVENSAGAIRRLPKTVDCHEQLLRIPLLLGQLAGARVGLSGFARHEPLGREDRQAPGQLQLDLPSIPSRTFGQYRQCS